MRELKFRAFDKLQGKYIAKDFHILGETTCFDIIGMKLKEFTPKLSVLERLKDVVIEQFTGLTDINEKEIYEGDILKWIGTTGDNEGVEFKNVVYFLSYRYRIKGTRNKKTFHADLNSNQIFNHKCEVIGNIHEHKNLIP